MNGHAKKNIFAESSFNYEIQAPHTKKEEIFMSTMKIVTPKGTIREVDKVVPVAETRFEFNGQKRRFVEIAKDLSVQPTALALHYADVNHTFGCEVELFVGNLSFTQVTEIQQSLIKDGFFDFSSLDYQKEAVIEDTVFDAGKSKAYTSDYTINIISNFTGTMFGAGFNNMGCDLFNHDNHLDTFGDVSEDVYDDTEEEGEE